jgi:hypothetical protein
MNLMLVGAAAVALGTAAATFGVTSSYYSSRLDAERARNAAEVAQAVAESESKRATLAMRTAELADALRDAQATERIRVIEVKKEVQRVVQAPVYRDCKLDDDGLRVYNAAASGMSVEPAAVTSAAVRENAPVAQVRRNDGGSAGGSGGGLRPVPRLPDRP